MDGVVVVVLLDADWIRNVVFQVPLAEGDAVVCPRPFEVDLAEHLEGVVHRQRVF
jgi:hypothetical protein